MKLKKLYKKVGPKNRLEVRGIKVLKMPTNGVKHFSTKFVKEAQAQGWLTLDYVQEAAGEQPTTGKLTIHGEDGNVVFNVVRGPGRYSCHGGEKLPDDDHTNTPGKLAQEYVAKHYAGIASPDTQNPAGYVCPRFYNCELEA